MSTSTEHSPAGIDPRGPRFGAIITSILLLTTVFFASSQDSLGIAFGFLVFVAVSFAIGAFAENSKHPYAIIYKKFAKPYLTAPKELEDPRPPRFSQLVGLIIVSIGILLYLVGAQGALIYVAGLAFIAAFLNAAFGFCLGCQIYVALQRIGLIKQH